MILTTGNEISGKNIREYKGIVFGEVITGGRSQSYEDELTNARENALKEMEERAASLGANAVIGVDVDYEVLGSDNGMLMVAVSGTAVITD